MTPEQRRTSGLIPGGKSLSGDGTHSPIVQTRVDKNTRETLKQVADEAGIGVSKLVRPAVEDQTQYFVLWEQQFDGPQSPWEWVRFDKPLTIDRARDMFAHYRGLAERLNYRAVQIRRGRDLVVDQWSQSV